MPDDQNGAPPIPPADPNYPLYALQFDVDDPSRKREGIFGQQIPGSHRLVVSAGGRRIRISYEHNDPEHDRKPILKVMIEDIGPDAAQTLRAGTRPATRKSGRRGPVAPAVALDPKG
jgi:hypothetical protein